MSIELREIVKEFADPAGRSVRAVDGISLEIARGELVTLLGPSGCGKTTTLRMIGGFEMPTRGRILVHGKDVTDAPAHLRGTPMVFQSYALFPHLSVRDNARFGLSTRKLDKAAAMKRIEALAQTMGLADLLDRAPHQLSGGQQQRVALLRALVTEPEVLLFDEPLSNLDARLRVEMRTEIRRIQRRSGVTAVYVTHDQEEAMVLSDRIVVMERGQIAQIGTPREVYTRPASKFVAAFLGDATFVPGQVVSEKVIDCPLGQVPVASAAAAGSTVTLVVRPEAVRVTTDGGVRATVRSVAYLGSHVAYELVVGDVLLLARAGAGASFSEGETVFVSLDASALHAL